MDNISENLKHNYIKHYNYVIEKRKQFKINKKVKNILSNEEFSFGSNPLNKIKQDYNWLVFNAVALEKKHAKKINNIAILLTLTLDTQFNRYKLNRNDILIFNAKYNKDNTIHQSYQVLNNFFKSLYQNFKVNQKWKKFDFLKVFEPMQNFTPHLHSVIFLNKDYFSNFESYVNKKILNDKNLGRFDIQIINTIQRSSAYLLKYVNKNFDLNNTNQEFFKVYYGWKLKNKIKSYSFTKTYLNREIFDRISFHLSKQYIYNEDMVEYLNSNNYYEVVDMFTSIQTTIINLSNGEMITKIKEASEDDIFVIRILKNREIIKDINYLKVIELNNILNNYYDKSTILSTFKKLKLFDKFNFFVSKNSLQTISQVCKKELKILLLNFIDELKNKYRYKYTTISYKIYKKHFTGSYYTIVFDKDNLKLINNERKY